MFLPGLRAGAVKGLAQMDCRALAADGQFGPSTCGAAVTRVQVQEERVCAVMLGRWIYPVQCAGLLMPLCPGEHPRWRLREHLQ